MKNIRKISHPSEKDLNKGIGDHAIVDEPSMIIKKSKTDGDLLRFAYEITYRTDYDDDYNIIKSVVVLYPENSYLYELDSDTDLEFDDDEGTAKFFSSEYEYVVRAIQPEDGDSWDLLKNWNRSIDPQNSARS